MVKIPYGKGCCYLLSGAIRYQMKSQTHLMDVILKDMGKSKQYESDAFRVISKKYQGRTKTYVMNPHPFEMEETILLHGRKLQMKLSAYEYKVIL